MFARFAPAFSNSKVIFSTFSFPFTSSFLSQSSRVFSQSRYHSVVKMTSPGNWQDEKNKLIKLKNVEERRKLYKIKDFITLGNVDTWANYVVKNKAVELRKPNLDDITLFKTSVVTKRENEMLTQKVSLWQGDITKLEVDAIVNAANSRLKAGGGVDGAIHRAAGPLLQDECDTLGGCPTGDAKITCGYDLPAQYVIHTVGPQDGSEAKLQSCYKKCFDVARVNNLTSIAFPCISTGIYGFPNRLASHIALQTARKELEKNPVLERVIFCTFLPIDIEIYETLMQIYFATHEWNFNDGASVTE